MFKQNNSLLINDADIRRKPYTVALTGGIGSGKSTIAAAFAKLGVDVVDTDIIARQIVRPGGAALRAIGEKFGNIMLNNDGSLNRTALREHIFSSSASKRWLDELLHPMIISKSLRQLARCRSTWCLWVVPLLVENNLQTLADRVLVVDVSPQTQIRRTASRDNVSAEQVKKIIACQATRQARLAVANDIIDNNGSTEQALTFVVTLHQRYCALATAKKD